MIEIEVIDDELNESNGENEIIPAPLQIMMPNPIII